MLASPVIFRSLGYRPFALLWAGQTVSRVGDFVYQVALAWWVLEKTGSAVTMGAVLVVSFAPMLLFLLLAGVAVDRFPRVQVMLLSDVARGLVVSLVAALAFAGRLEVWHVYIAGVVFGVADAFFQPAYTAAVPDVTPAEALPSANALTSFSLQGGRIVGPALGAGVIGLAGAPAAFALNGLSFFVSALLLLPLLRLPAPRPPAAPSGGVVQDARAGMGFVLGTRWLWIAIAILALTNITLAGPFSVTIPFLVRDTLQANVGFLGLLYAMFPIGAVVTAAGWGRLAPPRHRGRLMYTGVIGAGLGMLLLGLPLPAPALLAAAVFNGAALEVCLLIWMGALQRLVPSAMLGRVASIDQLGTFGVLPMGYALAGWATELLGAAPVCLLGGALTVVFALLGVLHPATRDMD